MLNKILFRLFISPIIGSILAIFFGLILNYLIICFINGYIWTTKIADTYYFLIIRIVVGIILGIISLLTMPVQHPEVFSVLFSHTVITYIIIATLNATIMSLNLKILDKIIYFFSSIFLVVIINIYYWHSLYFDNSDSSTYKFILDHYILSCIVYILCILMGFNSTKYLNNN